MKNISGSAFPAYPFAYLGKTGGLILLFACLVLPVTSLAQIKISPYLIGQNAWERNAVFKVQDQISQAKFQSIRIGGNGYENTGFITKGAEALIDYARAVGAEPIFQMPRQLKNYDKAYEAVAYLNGKLGKNIKFWSIGNEPDHKNQLATPEEVYDYFTKISAAIKRYDPNAKVMGFDLSSYKPAFLNRLLGGDLDVTGKVPGKDYYYLDAVAFHGYKFADITKFENEVKELKTKLAPLNAQRPANRQIGWAITEFNSHWLVDPKLDEKYWPYTFHNGQVYAEMYNLGMREGAFSMNPWSMLEGGADREGTDLSLFDLIDGKYLPRSNFYHSQLLARNFKANYLTHQDAEADLVVIPMGDSTGVTVMLLNKNRTTPYNYTISLNGKAAKTKDLAITIQAGLNKKYSGTIPVHATQVLVFDNKGKLRKEINYSARDADAKTAPQVQTKR